MEKEVFGRHKNDPSELLKKATSQKKDDIEAAISTLREAYKAISKGSTNYTVDTFLRLPMLLQKAGHSDEAWSELNHLIANGYPNQMRTEELIPMDHSAIYDKMRLFLQREKKPREAIKFGVFSHLSWCIGLHNQSRKTELRSTLSKESIENVVKSLTIKANAQAVEGELVNMLLEEIEKFPDVELSTVGKAIDEQISTIST